MNGAYGEDTNSSTTNRTNVAGVPPVLHNTSAELPLYAVDPIQVNESVTDAPDNYSTTENISLSASTKPTGAGENNITAELISTADDETNSKYTETLFNTTEKETVRIIPFRYTIATRAALPVVLYHEICNPF